MTRKEECRHLCLEHLAERPRLAFPAASIQRPINRMGGDFTLHEVQEALEFLTGLGHAEEQPDGLGSTRYYKITAGGTLFFERSQ